jgi:hypothetical protein
MAMTVKVFTTQSFPHIIHAFNMITAFCTIECKKPSLAARITVVNTKGSAKRRREDMCRLVFLQTCNSKRDFQKRLSVPLKYKLVKPSKIIQNIWIFFRNK